MLVSELGLSLLLILRFVVLSGGVDSTPLLTFTPAEEEHINSVTVRIHSLVDGATIYYSLDGANPTLNSASTLSGDPIVIDNIGETRLRAMGHLTGTDDTPIYEKVYRILERCAKPTIFPDGGTFAGSVQVTITSSVGATLRYTIDNSNPTDSSPAVPNDGVITVHRSGTLKVIAMKIGMAPSSVSSAEFAILPKVSAPTIHPDVTVFAISATITITCSTENATIYYTTDGSLPTLLSLTVDPDSPQLVIDVPGLHQVRAFATVPSMLRSDVSSKTYTILQRAPAPAIHPPSGTYVSEVTVSFECNNISTGRSADEVGGGREGMVYFTTDGKATPSSSSQHVTCNQHILLNGPGRYTVRAYVDMAQRSPSSIVESTFVLVRQPYDEHPVFPNASLLRQPIVDIFVVAKNIPYTSYYQKGHCPDRNVRGHLVVLHNPVGHVDVLEPLNGCGGGLSLPSLSGKQNFLPTVEPGEGEAVDGLYSPLDYYRDQLSHLSSDSLRVWKEEFDTSLANGCEVVINAGFFNISSTNCFGDLVTAGRVVQTSDKHNVNFGIRNGKFVVGHVGEEEVRVGGFDTLVSGLGWLVRDGAVYVQESFHPLYDQPEDMSPQTAGDQFSTVLSARTAIGHDAEGRLLMLQVEGETWSRGMSLFEFADFAKEVGFVSAVNLDGGGSATMTVNHTLVSEPSWKCERVKDMLNVTHNGDIGSASIDYDGDGYRYCEKPVSSVICIHSMPPPNYRPRDTAATDTPVFTPSPAPSPRTAYPSQTHLRSHQPSEDPSRSPQLPRAPASQTNSTLRDAYVALQSSEAFYKSLSATLSVALAFSVAVHLAVCCWKRGQPPMSQFQRHPSPEGMYPAQRRECELPSIPKGDIGRGPFHSGGESLPPPTARPTDVIGSPADVDIHDPSWQPKMSNGALEGLGDSSDEDDLPPVRLATGGQRAAEVEEDDDEDIAETAQLVPKGRSSSQKRERMYRAEQTFEGEEVSIGGSSVGKKKMTRDEEDFGVMTAADLRDSGDRSSGSWFKKKKKGKKKNFESDGL